jgi:hypothetical protein
LKGVLFERCAATSAYIPSTGLAYRIQETSPQAVIRLPFPHPNAASVSFATSGVVSLGRFTTMAQRARLNIAFEYM